MNLSYRWLRELASDLTDSPQQVAARLAMLGAPVDEVVPIGEALRDVVIARTVEVVPHPNSDHLSLCKVDAGGELLSVVCGAPNVTANKFYPFAPVGATLPGGLKLSQRKIRGELSQGMLCSPSEIGLGRDHSGILELQGEYAPGQSFVEALQLDDYRIVIDVTPNRPDLLSHFGVARELAQGGEASLQLPRARARDWTVERVSNDGMVGGIRIRIEAAEDCPRYLASVVRGVKIGPSPEWLAMRLRAIGQRPINNVVDATNFVLHELGQPLHAFDLRKLGGSAIVVRKAKAGEKLVTLDGASRELNEHMLVIADAERATALAGVMGGLESEVTETTEDVLIECAHFERKQIRSTRRALGMSTDASYRFERGVDPVRMDRALQRVTDLIVQIAGGTAEPRLLDVAPLQPPARQIGVRMKRIAQVLGESFTPDQVIDLLRPIGIEGSAHGQDVVQCKIPGHRLFDLQEEIDLVEEIARRFGYDQFPTESRAFRPSSVPDHPLSQLEDELRRRLSGRGLLEVRTAGFAAETEGDIALQLPLASTESRLRRAVLPGLLHRVEYNFTRGVRDVRLFEIGTAFGALDESGRPAETTRLAVALTGSRNPPHWSGGSADFDIWDLRGLAEELAEWLGLELRPAGDALELTAGQRTMGSAAAVAKGAVDAPAWAASVFALEVLLEPRERQHVVYQPLPQFPAIEQDLALLVPHGIRAAAVADSIRAAGGALLETVSVFDLYEGKGIPEGTRSLAYRLRFRAADRTLTDADAATAVGRILKRLKDEHGITRR